VGVDVGENRLAGFTRQLRPLPVLLMLVVSIMGLTAVQRSRTGRRSAPRCLGRPLNPG
jgi:hypothetical protein